MDFLIDDDSELCVLPIEVKSGKDYTVHSALSKFLDEPEYHIPRGIVLSSERQLFTKNRVTYMPIYYVMFIDNILPPPEQLYF